MPNSASPSATFDGTSLTWVRSLSVGINQAFTVSFTVVVTDDLPNALEIVNQTYSITGGNVFSQAFGAPVTVTVETPVTLTITKSDDPDPVDAGDLITYTLIVTNDSSSKGPAGNVVVTDTIPVSTTLVDAGFNGPATGVTSTLGSEVIWTLTNPDPLLRDASASMFMVVQVDSPLTNNTVITNDTYTVGTSNDLATVLGQPLVTTTVKSTPTLEIFKQGLPATVEAGGQLTYTIRYTNSGNADATGVIISDTFPLSTNYVIDVSDPDVSPGITTSTDIVWNIPVVAGEGGGGVITLTLDVLPPQDPGTILTNVVSITSSEVTSPTLFTATNTITSTPELHITKSADPDPVAVGSFLTYTIVYSNDGNADAVGAAITDVLDSGVSFNGASAGGSFSNGEVSWTGLTVPADGLDRTLLMSVTVASTLPNNSILTNNVVIVSGSLVATDSITTLVQAPTLTVTKIVSPTGVVRAGDTIEYTIRYTNTGAITITNPGILITDTLPVSITNIVSGSTDATFVTASPPEYVWSQTTDLAANGGFGVITITGQVITSPWASTGGQISNAVVVAGSGYSATDTVDIEGRPGLPFTITVNAVPTTQQVGQNVLVEADAEDAFGNPVFDGTPITFTTSLLGSTINPVVVPAGGGIASANLSSTVANSTTVTAQIAGASTPLTDTTVVTFTPGGVVSFTLQATTPQTAGVTFPITITAVDAFGNRVNTVNQAITINDTTGTIAPITVNLVNGAAIGNFTVFSATSPALDTITAISGTISGTVGVEIRPNTPTTLAVSVNPTSIRVCQTANVTATITDNFGNPIPNRAVNLGTAPPSANFAPASGNTNSAGIFTSLLTGTAAGSPNPVSVVATSNTPSPSLNGSTNININNPPVATNMSLTVTPNPLATGGNTATVTATLNDCNGPSAGQVVTFTVSNPALAFFASNPINATTNPSGVATAILTSNSTPLDGSVVITATNGDLTRTVTVVLQTPVLTITKTANPVSGSEVRPGQTINYTLQVINTGTGAANNVVITDVLPAGVSFVACTPVALCSGGSTTTVTTPTLGAGQSLSANIQVSVTAATSGTIISNVANARSSQTGLITSNIVAHPVTTATVDLFLPIIMKDFAALPDLVVSSFSISPANPTTGQPVVVTVVINNAGTGPTGDGFWVDFYINPTPVPTVGNQRWDALGSTVSPKQGIAWAILSPGLAPGASITLTSNGVGGLAPSGPQTIWSGSFVAGTQDLYVYADSFSSNGSPNGGIVESNESNNRSELHFINPLEADGQIDLSGLPDPAFLPPRWDP